MPGGNHSANHNLLVRSVIEYLRINRAWTFKVMGGLGQKPGVCDVIACIKDPKTGAGRIIGVECKTGRARLSAAQLIETASMREAGALVIECRQLEDLEDALVDAGLVTPSLYRRKEQTPCRK